jgi:parallel beta-helix repeat protein
LNKLFSGIALTLLLVSMLAFFSPHIAPVYAAGTVVCVVNASTGNNLTLACLHGSVTINISIENSPNDMAGYQLTLLWNSSILNCTSFTDNPPSAWGNNIFNATDQLNRTNPGGIASYQNVKACMLFGLGAPGNHVVNTLNFTVIGNGETTLQLQNVVVGTWGDPTHNWPITVYSGVFETLASPIYILPDGSVSPLGAPIQRNGSIYTLTGNISTAFTTGIMVQKGNITINGAGYILQGNRLDGLNITGINHVTIHNMGISNFDTGIQLDSSSNNSIVGNNVRVNNELGIQLIHSSNSNRITGNNITANGIAGIQLSYYSSNNNISENNVANNRFQGIMVGSNYNNVMGNNVTANKGAGIELDASFNNDVIGNNVANNSDGIDLAYSSNNSAIGNNITNSGLGMFLDSSSNNTISANSFVNGGLLVNSFGNIVNGNLVNGKPLVYLEGASSYRVADAGQIILLKCVNMTVENLNLSNTAIGVELLNTNNTIISGNNMTSDKVYGIFLGNNSNNIVNRNTIMNNTIDGIDLYLSLNNSISDNNITANNRYGISLWWSSNNNIYHNHFVNNTKQALDYGNLTNVWDDGSKGNYWSDYLTKYPNATEIDNTGVGNTPYVIDVNNTDHYPLLNQPVIPEFPSYLMLPLMMIATLLAVIVYRRKHRVKATLSRQRSARQCAVRWESGMLNF